MKKTTTFLLALAGICSFMLVDQYIFLSRDADRPQRTDKAKAAEPEQEREQEDTVHAATPRADRRDATLLVVDPQSPRPERHKAYIDHEVMVAPMDGETLESIARTHDVQVTRSEGPSGYGSITVPEGMEPMDFVGELLEDGAVYDAARNAYTYGAATRANPYQWHLDAADAPSAGTADLSDWVVAVLDTGVAYEDFSDGMGTYVQAPSFASTNFVSPRDFINDDLHPNDDHQHGTHIASCIGSYGVMEGVAAGVSIMPVKVLDEHNGGTELALIDGIAWAVSHGADVINMSLSFGEAYKPSRPLKRALRKANRARVLMVAASGNDGADFTTYPAAHPQVIAVGAHAPDGTGSYLAAPYSNRSPDVDIMAPGGDLGADRDGDGLPDGILAESIFLNDPSATGYWFYAGTSQATAMVSGAIVHMLDAGYAPRKIKRLIQKGAVQTWGSSSQGQGYGAGRLYISGSVSSTTAAAITDNAMKSYSVAVLPYLTEDLVDTQTGNALITVMDETGMVVPDVTVYGLYKGSSRSKFSCVADANGQCTVSTGAVDAIDGNGDPIGVGWTFKVSSVMVDGVAQRPTGAMFLTDALEILVAAVEQQTGEDIKKAMLAFSWQDAYDENFGELEPAYSVINSGTGLASSPLGMVVNMKVMDDIATMTDVDVDLDGTGLASSPLGMARLTFVTLDGTGLASSPLGLKRMDLLALDGTGLASSPLGLTALKILAPVGSSALSEAVPFDGDAFFLGSSSCPALSLDGSYLGAKLQVPYDTDVWEGGWITDEGYEGGEALEGSSVVNAIEWEPIEFSGSGAGDAILLEDAIEE